MSNLMHNFIWKYVPHSLISMSKFLFQRKSFLYETGFLRSLWTNKPYTKSGEPTPWLTYSAICFLNEKLTQEMKVFEYGSGISTEYYAKRVASVTAVEHYKKWYDLVNEKLSNIANAEVVFKELDSGAYAKAPVDAHSNFDVVIVDGRQRLECLSEAIKCLTDDGVVIFDDAEREKYASAYPFMKGQGFSMIKFLGLRPSSCYFDSTVVFYKAGNNVFNI